MELIAKDACSTGSVGPPLPLSSANVGTRGQDLPFWEEMFGYSFYTLFTTNTSKVAFSSQLGTLILKLLPWAQPWLALWLDTGYERIVWQFFIMRKCFCKLSSPTPLTNSEGHIAKILRKCSHYWQQKQPNDGVLGRLILKVPTWGTGPISFSFSSHSLG